MNVRLSPEAESIVLRLVSSGRCRNAAAVIEEARKALEERERAKFEHARELILAGHNSGPGRELTDEVWEEMERAVDEAYARGDEPPPHLRP